MTHDHRRSSRHRAGFTLLELSISVALLVIVALLGFVAARGSMKSVDLTRRMTTLQEELRSSMRALSDQVQSAVKRPRLNAILPPGAAQSLRVVNPTTITFVTPTNMTGAAFSGVTTIQFVDEDLPDTGIDGGQFGNGQLNSGEDTNSNGVLDRQLVMTLPNGTQQVLGSGGHLADMVFTLSPDGGMLQVAMVATMRLEQSKTRMLQYRLASNIFMMN
jgi:prepilin-type N-terminal cleavage/methylation domain-containing protein